MNNKRISSICDKIYSQIVEERLTDYSLEANEPGYDELIKIVGEMISSAIRIYHEQIMADDEYISTKISEYENWIHKMDRKL